jgi:hypothetical protein
VRACKIGGVIRESMQTCGVWFGPGCILAYGDALFDLGVGCAQI